MLGCRFYLGKVRYNEEEYTAQHEAIVTEELFNRVQSWKMKRGITRNSDGNPDSPQAVVFLTSIIDVTVGY